MWESEEPTAKTRSPRLSSENQSSKSSMGSGSAVQELISSMASKGYSV